MRRSLITCTVVCTAAFSGLAAAYVPWEHGTYHGPRTANHGSGYQPPLHHAALPAPRANNWTRRSDGASAAQACYRYDKFGDANFIRCYWRIVADLQQPRRAPRQCGAFLLRRLPG